MKIADIINNNFKQGSLIMTYYRYMEKFHCEPKEWQDLFDYLDFNNTDNEINKVLIAETKKD